MDRIPIDAPLTRGYVGNTPILDGADTTKPIGNVLLATNVRIDNTILKFDYVDGMGASQTLSVDLRQALTGISQQISLFYGLSAGQAAVDTSGTDALAKSQSVASFSSPGNRSTKAGALNGAGVLVQYDLHLDNALWYFPWIGIETSKVENLRFFNANGNLESDLWVLAGSVNIAAKAYSFYVRTYQLQGSNDPKTQSFIVQNLT